MGVARTDDAAGVPRRVAEALSDYLSLKIVELPFRFRGFYADVALIWHSRTHADPAARHFQETVLDALGSNLRKPERTKRFKVARA